MNSTRFAQIKDIFLRACQLQGEERKEYLAEACGHDPELLSEIDSLLDHHLPETLLTSLQETNEGSSSQLSSIWTHDAQREFWIGKQLGKYRITRVIDSGGMGIVLQGYDAAIDRQVAIKVLHAELASNEQILKRFHAEARAAGRLNHPNIVTVYEIGDEDGVHFLAMEYVEGGSTADHLKQSHSYNVEEATRIAIEACQGVGAAHEAGLVHRDIKPANLLVSSSGTIKVTDFGVAKLGSGQSLQLTRQGQLVGTPNFMSPEQCEGSEVDARSDVYSLGATYFSLLVGRSPFEEYDSLVSVINAHCNAAPPDPRDYNNQLPEVCSAVIEKAMAKSPADRYQSAEEMIDALKAVGTMLSDKQPARVPRRQSAIDSRRNWLIAGASALVALVGFVSWSYFSPNRPGDDFSGVPLAEREPIKIGILHSFSGTMYKNEEVIVDAYQLAIEEINDNGGVLGRPIERISGNGDSNDKTFSKEARRLIDEEKVCTIFGCSTSSSRKAVKEVVEEKKHLLVYSVNHEGLETSPNIIYLGGDPSQTIMPCVDWAVKTDRKQTFFLVGSDYVFPQMVNIMVRRRLDQLDAKVVGEAYIPLGSSMVTETVEHIKGVQPQAIINTISGDTQDSFMRVLRSQGVNATQYSTGIGEEALKSNITRLSGDYSCCTYFQSIDTPENKEFVRKFHERFGNHRAISAAMESAYVAVHLWAKGVESARSIKPLKIRDAMLEQTIIAPSGPIHFDHETQYAYRFAYIGRVRKDGQFLVQDASPKAIAPTPYPKPYDKQHWEKQLDELFESYDGHWAAQE